MADLVNQVLAVKEAVRVISMVMVQCLEDKVVQEAVLVVVEQQMVVLDRHLQAIQVR